MDPQAAQVRHAAASRRFTVQIDGHEGRLDYALDGGTLVITHTVVPEAIGGRGIAGALVEAALVHARQNGFKVVPRCSYAGRYLSRHPEYADLLAEG